MTAVVAAVALLVAVPDARAEHDDGYGEHPTFDRSPERGPRGTVIELWGTGCIYRGTPWERARVYFEHQPSGQGSYSTPSEFFPIKDDGSWAGELVVPSLAPPGDYLIHAECYASDMVLPAGDRPFTATDVTSPTTSTTTTTATTTTTTTATTTTTTTAAPRARSATTTSMSTTTTTAPSTSSTTPATVVAAPAATDRPEGGGGPRWGLLAATTAALLACGTAGMGVLRRRRTTRGTGRSG